MKSVIKSTTRRQTLRNLAACVGAICTHSLARAANATAPIRVAISEDTLAGANVNDARAAYTIYVRELSHQLGTLDAVPVPGIFLPSDVLIRGVRQGLIDAYGVTALEFEKLVSLTCPESILLQDYLADGMEYVLLVHNNSSFKKIGDLRGASVVSHLHEDMILLHVWLGTLLAGNGLPQAERFFAAQTLSDRVNQVLLPVFFRRVDGACLARRTWETATELNPQLGRDLRPLAISPKIVPILLGFHRDTTPGARKAFIEATHRVYSFTQGQQIVALYQSSRIIERPTSVMNGTLEMIRQFERISGRAPDARKAER